MAENSKIQWTRHTANLWWGCVEVHDGCDNCYARVFAFSKGKGSAWEGVRYACTGVWKELPKWQKSAAAAGEVHRVFCGSMMDIFERPMPASDWGGKPLGITTGDIRDRFFREVVPACPNLQFQLLTKRPGNVRKSVPTEWMSRWPANVLTGASVVDQATADTLVTQLLRVPGPVFLSVEPLIGPVNLRRLDDGAGETFDALTARVTTRRGHSFLASGVKPVAWVIVGGESGGKARPCHQDWVRSVVDQCKAAGVPVFVKQMGANSQAWTLPGHGPVVEESRGWNRHFEDQHGGDPAEWDQSLNVREFPAVVS